MKWNLGFKEIFQKIGFFRLMLLSLAGVVLLFFSFPENNQQKEQKTLLENTYNEEQMALNAMEVYSKKKENEVAELLEQAEGIGKVKVMITLASSEERVPMQDGQSKEENIKESDKEGGSRDTSRYEMQKENILVQGQKGEEPYVVQIYAPSVEGVAVVAEGAGNSTKKKEIIETIQALFHIEAHKIKVMKMEHGG